MKRLFWVVILVFGISSQLSADASEIKGQCPIPVVEDSFKFIPGSWAVYSVRDIAKNTTSKIWFFIEKQLDKKGKPAAWMEIEVQSPDEPAVVTRLLAEETKDGPGKLHEVIVQVKGHRPFKVPSKYYKEEDSKVGDFQPLQVQSKAEKKTITWKDKTLNVYEVEATDSNGLKSKTIVSEEVPPLGVISILTTDTEMTLDSWGTDAKSKIKGKPINFYLWLLLEAGNAL